MTRFGILGAAAIARNFTRGIAGSRLVKVEVLGSRDLAKGRAFAADTGIARVHGSYEAVLVDPAVDAVYIPLPNHLHCDWAIRAAEAGKHILCEKPLALNLAEARRMFDAADANGVRLVEAYPYRAQPQTQRMAALLAEGAIGRVQTIQASFGATFGDPTNIRMDPARGGGVLLDGGSYVVSLARLIAGEKPRRVLAAGRWGDTGVDVTMTMTLDFPCGILAQLSCSFRTPFHRQALITGDGGAMTTSFLNHPPLGGPPELRVKRGMPVDQPWETVTTTGGDGFLAEAEAFHALLQDGPRAWTGATRQESLDIAEMLDAIMASARCGEWVDLS